MKTRNIIYGTFTLAVSITLTAICILSNFSKSELFLTNNEAITTGETNYNPGDRLKKVDCTCKNGKSGFSLRCKSNGNQELCSEIQQGSNACYKNNLIEQDLKLICEGDDVEFFE
ncbi:MAG: hypothetical protein J6K74_03115 [Marinifilaceae bacterium]|nr:hypothetical protein [Marinifilaceae bacterium]